MTCSSEKYRFLWKLIEKELDSEEVIDMDMDLDEVLQEADGFSWDSIVDNDDDGEHGCHVG